MHVTSILNFFVFLDERGYTYVGDSHDFDSRIDFIIANQHVTVAGASTVGDLTGSNVCTASDHLNVDAIVDFFGTGSPPGPTPTPLAPAPPTGGTWNTFFPTTLNRAGKTLTRAAETPLA